IARVLIRIAALYPKTIYGLFLGMFLSVDFWFLWLWLMILELEYFFFFAVFYSVSSLIFTLKMSFLIFSWSLVYFIVMSFSFPAPMFSFLASFLLLSAGIYLLFYTLLASLPLL
ncbi:hypothetical protein L9F63_009701, partial [Diploptera punctata]